MKKIVVINFNQNNINFDDAYQYFDEVRGAIGQEYAVLGTFKEFADIKCINDENAIIYIDGTHSHYTIDELRAIIQEHERQKCLVEVKNK